MASSEIALLLLAAVGAGAMNAVVGAGTLITFPTLLALGFPPVIANVSNTVGLVPGSVAAAYGFRSTLVGRWPLVSRLVVASAVGGVIGGGLLLALPAGAFAIAVPPLLLLSAVLAAIQPRVAAYVLRRREARDLADASEQDLASDEDLLSGEDLASGEAPASEEATTPGGSRAGAGVRIHPALILVIALTGIYGGYFGAAQGVILLAVLGVFVEGGMTEVNGMKNVLAGMANLVSAGLFIAIADVNWQVAVVVALGATLGGGLGARYGRRLPANVLRPIVVGVAVAAAIWQFLT
jgi:uncharacterized protein